MANTGERQHPSRSAAHALPVWWRWVPQLPILIWGRRYNRNTLRRDVTAGLTVGAMLVPQSMAYATLAGVPPVMGLYASLAPLVIYTLTGTSRQAAVGVVAIDMLLVGTRVAELSVPGTPEFIALTLILTSMVGALQLLMGVARLGFVAELFSRPIVVGFTSAASLLILMSQVGGLLGVDTPGSATLLGMGMGLVLNLQDLNPASCWLGGLSVAVLLLMDRWSSRFPKALMVMVLGSAAVWAFDLHQQGVEVVGEVAGNFPEWHIPTINTGSIKSLFPTAITLALLQFMTLVSIGRTFSAKHHYAIGPNQELVAMGSANLVSSLSGGVPISGSFSRSAVNDQAGAQTPGSNLVAATMVAVTLAFLTPLLEWLPRPVLSAIIVVAAWSLVDLRMLRYLLRIKRRDGLLALLTFACALLLGPQEGIGLGVAASVLAFLYRVSRPRIVELGQVGERRAYRNIERDKRARTFPGLLILRVDAGLYFFNSAYITDYILRRSGEGRGRVHALVIAGGAINDLDTTAVEALGEMLSVLEEWNVAVYFAGLKGPVRDVLSRSGLATSLRPEQFSLTVHEAVTRAREWIASREQVKP